MAIFEREPKQVLKFFEEISRIPRGSGNEKAISTYLVDFAKKRGLEVKQDAALNVVIYKPGSAGRENRPPLILQSHMDMVCEKNAGTDHDFLKDPIALRVEGDFLYGTDTTLGADNGAGMAVSLALLDSDEAVHPPLEAVFTVEEETTMKGISALDANWLKARRMINMDSGNDTTFCVGCAGGGRLDFAVPVLREKISEDAGLGSGLVCKLLTVRGLAGGHSGVEIHLGNANSIRTLGRALEALRAELPIRIINVSGGLKANAIPREADAVIAIPAAEVGKAEQLLAALQQTLRTEYRVQDPGITLALGTALECTMPFTSESAQKVISAMLLLPYGVLHMCHDIPDLVETSNNIGVMETTAEAVSFDCALRSSVSSRRILVSAQIRLLAEALGAKVDFAHGYPGWTYNPDSPLLASAIAQYRETYKTEPNIEAIHAGLECGFMMEKIPDMDIISYCAELLDAHTPNEHMSISSLEKIWSYTLSLLNRL